MPKDTDGRFRIQTRTVREDSAAAAEDTGQKVPGSFPTAVCDWLPPAMTQCRVKGRAGESEFAFIPWPHQRKLSEFRGGLWPLHLSFLGY